MTKQEVILENPLVRELLDRAECDAIVQLDGFIGQSSETGYVRIYRDLTLSTCVDVERSDVVRSVSPDDGQPTDPTTIFVRGTAEVKFVMKSKVSETGTMTTMVNLAVDEIQRSTSAAGGSKGRECSCNSETMSQMLRLPGNNSGPELPPMDCEIRCELADLLCGDSWWCWLDRWMCDYHCRNPRPGGGLTIGI